MYDYDISGIQDYELAGQAQDLAQLIKDHREHIRSTGDVELELAGPEELETGYADAEMDTGAGMQRRRVPVKYPAKKAVRTTAKRASSSKASSNPQSGASDLSMKIEKLDQHQSQMEQAFGKLVGAIKKVAGAKSKDRTAAVGQRAVFSGTVANVASGALATLTNQVSNSDIEYDRVIFSSNVPGLFSACSANLNPILEGTATIVSNGNTAQGPYELSTAVKLNGTSGLTFSFTNRGAGAGDASVIFLPKGYAFYTQKV